MRDEFSSYMMRCGLSSPCSRMYFTIACRYWRFCGSCSSCVAFGVCPGAGGRIASAMTFSASAFGSFICAGPFGCGCPWLR